MNGSSYRLKETSEWLAKQDDGKVKEEVSMV
jgi:hypothetical protein